MTKYIGRFMITGIVAALPLLVMTSKAAYAYIDPGTGSYVLQVIAASVLAAVFVVKSKWQAIKNRLTKSSGDNDENAE